MPDNNNDYSDDDDHSSMNDDDNNHNNHEITSAPSLYQRPCFFRRTRQKGKILKTVQERYLRDDLGFGCSFWDPHATKRRKGAESTVGKPRPIESVTALWNLLVKSTSSSTTTSLVVIDTNVLLHNMDVLEQALSVSPNLVIPQTALEECRARQMTVYDQAVELLRSVGDSTNKQRQQRCGIFFPDQHHIETQVVQTAADESSSSSSINDVNDARIRKVALYYGKQLSSTTHNNNNVRVIFLTDDADSKRKALQEQQQELSTSTTTTTTKSKSKKKVQEASLYYQPMTVKQWVQELERDHPGLSLMDYVAHYGSTTTAAGGSSRPGQQQQQKEPCFPPHVSATQVSQGIQTGTYHRGVFRSTTDYSQQQQQGLVTIRKGDERVAITIDGWMDRNRAMDGDVVAVALHPIDKWIPLAGSTATSNNTNAAAASNKTTSDHSNNNKKTSATGISQETSEPTYSEMSNVAETMTIDHGNDNDDETAAAAQSLRPTGKIIGLIRRKQASYSGSILETSKHSTTTISTTTEDSSSSNNNLTQYEQEHPDGSTTCVFVPVDTKIPPLLIRTTQRDRLIGQRLVVAMDSWPSESPYPLGHYTKTLGQIGDKSVETQVLLLQHNIPYEAFPAQVLACLPPADYNLQQDYLATKDKDQRVDLRHLPILSIDPPGCTDIDDALHCFQMDNGNYQVGVHIADVTHYVQAGSAMDLEAANRSTSTYLVDRRLDMLPSLLSTDLCSLKGNVDRFAFSVLWEVTPQAEIVDVKFQKSLIHSIAALTYQEAQTMIDLPDTPEHNQDPQVAAVKGLAKLARLFRKRRIDAGALTLASPEVKFVFDSESLNPTDVQAYAMLEANDLVMEFMLLANVTVGKKILRHYPTLSVLRRHPAPNRARFDGLISKAKSRGFDLVIDDSKQFADSLDAAQLKDDPYFNKLLRICATRCLSPAQYFCSGEYRPTEWHHYGLAAPVYTHFTSPIRRYADVCVHRLLAAAIGVSPLPLHLSSKTYMHDLCANMNRRQRAARDAGRSSVQLHTLIFFAGSDGDDSSSGGGGGSKEEHAYVLDVETAPDTEPAMTVIVPRYGIEGQVKLPIGSGDNRLSRFPAEHRLTFEDDSGSKTSIRVFDKVKVKVWVRVSPNHQRELVLDLLEPTFGNSLKRATSSSIEELGAEGSAKVQTKKKRKTRK